MDRSLHLSPKALGHGKGGLRLLDGPREAIEDIATGPGGGDHRFAQHVHDRAIRDQIAVVDVRPDRLPERRMVPDVLAQQVAAGDVRDAEPPGKSLRLCSLARAGGADQQKAHLNALLGALARPAGITSRGSWARRRPA